MQQGGLNLDPNLPCASILYYRLIPFLGWRGVAPTLVRYLHTIALQIAPHLLVAPYLHALGASTQSGWVG